MSALIFSSTDVVEVPPQTHRITDKVHGLPPISLHGTLPNRRPGFDIKGEIAVLLCRSDKDPFLVDDPCVVDKTKRVVTPSPELVARDTPLFRKKMIPTVVISKPIAHTDLLAATRRSIHNLVNAHMIKVFLGIEHKPGFY